MPLHAYEITPEMKAQFLELIYAGHKANTAAEEIGTTGTRMRYFRSRKSQYYDEEFADAWVEAETSEEHRVNREEELRALVDERSRKSDTVLIKRALVELPEWEPLRHQNFHHDIDVKILSRHLTGLTEEELERVIAAKEAEEGITPPRLRALPKPAEDVT